MTLVARIMLNGAPFLIADALVSSDDLSNPHVTGIECELPLIGEINGLLAVKKRPFRVDLCQKLHVFEGRLAVAWAGDTRQAERALKVLRDIAKRPGLTLTDVQDELSAIDPDKIKDVSLVGNLLEAVNGNQIHASVFGRNAMKENITGFGEVQSAGSGARTFAQMLRRTESPPLSTGNDPWNGLSVVGSLLNHELTTGQSIDERWGGAYETASYSRQAKRMEKLDNVLHTFWSWRGDGKLDFQPRFYLARYYDELLMLRSAEYEIGENYSIKRLTSNKLQLVPSLLRPVRDDDHTMIGDVDFSYDYVCCHVWFRAAPGSVTPMGAVVLACPRGSLYDIDLSVAKDGSLHLRLPGDTVTNVFEGAKATADQLTNAAANPTPPSSG